MSVQMAAADSMVLKALSFGQWLSELLIWAQLVWSMYQGLQLGCWACTAEYLFHLSPEERALLLRSCL